MKRRDLILAAAGAAAAAAPAFPSDNKEDSRQFIELRRYSLPNGSKRQRFFDFMSKAYVPAINRLGIQPVGAFSVLYGQNEPSYTLYLLLPINSIGTFVSLNSMLLEDHEFLEKGASVLDLPIDDPAFLRYESTLMLAFSGMPTVELPPAVQGKGSRIFEMRTYESHCQKKAKKKIHMFNEGGEIEVFRKTGLNPVFFGETLSGRQMPNLTYMLAHENMEARDRNWAAFGKHPDWLALREKEEYKDTVSNITDIILRPAGFSQI